MLPRYERLDTKSLFQIPFGKFALAIVSLPFLSFIFCVYWSVQYFYERSTATHCGVPNYLPSISAAIGNYQPQRFIWQTAILLQAFPRLLIAYQYNKHYNVIIRKNRRPIAYTASIFNVVENFALVGLSLFTSSDDYGKTYIFFSIAHTKKITIAVFFNFTEIHKICFIIFIATSEIYMLISYFLNKNARKILGNLTRLEQKSLIFKRNLFLINITSFIMAGYFFVRHNSKCEAGGKSSSNYKKN